MIAAPKALPQDVSVSKWWNIPLKLGQARIQFYIKFQSDEPGPPLATSTTSKQDKVFKSPRIHPKRGFFLNFTILEALIILIFSQFSWAGHHLHWYPSQVLLTTMRDELYCTPSSRIVNIDYETPMDHKVNPNFQFQLSDAEISFRGSFLLSAMNNLWRHTKNCLRRGWSGLERNDWDCDILCELSIYGVFFWQQWIVFCHYH